MLKSTPEPTTNIPAINNCLGKLSDRSACLSPRTCKMLRNRRGQNNWSHHKPEVMEIQETVETYNLSPGTIKLLLEAGCVYIDIQTVDKLSGK